MNKKEINSTIPLQRTCTICNKVIQSLYDKQLESNFKEHMRIHEVKKWRS
jgi:hypothetical protein